MIIPDIYESTIFAKILFNLWDTYRGDKDALGLIHTSAKYGFDTNGVIYDTIEYIDTDFLILTGEIDSAEGQDELRERVEVEIKEAYPDAKVHTLTEEDKANFVAVGRLIYEDIKTDPEKLANYAAFLHLIDKNIPQPVNEFTELISLVKRRIQELK